MPSKVPLCSSPSPATLKPKTDRTNNIHISWINFRNETKRSLEKANTRT